MALMHMLARWASGGTGLPPILTATVDHGLRAESGSEAAWVAGEAARLGLTHRVLVWTGPKPKTGLQEAARLARYALLTAHARETGASHLATAHTLDDQAETILMRMAHGSGLAGLAGMRAERDLEGIRHVRPLLGVSKATLLSVCQDQQWAFVTDPSNANEHFARVRWRRILPALAQEGLTAERLSLLAARVARAEAALDAKAREALLRAVVTPAGAGDACGLDGAILAAEPFEIALRALEIALSQAVPSTEHKRLQRLEASLERLLEAIRHGHALRFTIAGALLCVDRTGQVRIRPESPRRRGL
jgi:tRNA(Ile)-lysidine synthase